MARPVTLRGLGEDRVIVPVEDSVPGELQSGAEQRQVVAVTNSRCRIVVVEQLWCPSRNARTVISPSPSAKVLPLAVNCVGQDMSVTFGSAATDG